MYQFFIISLASAEESKISESEMCIYVHISTYQVEQEQKEGRVEGRLRCKCIKWLAQVYILHQLLRRQVWAAEGQL